MAITVTPDPFTLIEYDAKVIVGIVEDAAARAEFPTGVDIHLDVDEELFAPLVGTAVDIVDGKASLWISGAKSEGPKGEDASDEDEAPSAPAAAPAPAAQVQAEAPAAPAVTASNEEPAQPQS